MRRRRNSDEHGHGGLFDSLYSRRVLSFLILGLFLALGYLRIKGEEIRLGYEISRGRSEIKRLIRDTNSLSAQYKKLIRPSRIGEKARQMGFKFPTQNDIIYVEQTTLVGERDEQ